MRFLPAVAALLFVATGALAADFVGAESCKACHAEAFEAWKLSKHARAKDSLSPSQQKDARCLTCHSPNEADQRQAHVACETCHGGGQHYSPAYVMKDQELSRLVGLVDPSEKSCRTCHDASSPSLQPFEFVEKLKLIDHWSAERIRRGKAPKETPKDQKDKKPASTPAPKK